MNLARFFSPPWASTAFLMIPTSLSSACRPPPLITRTTAARDSRVRIRASWVVRERSARFTHGRGRERYDAGGSGPPEEGLQEVDRLLADEPAEGEPERRADPDQPP